MAMCKVPQGLVLSYEITPELIEKMDAHDKKLEALKMTDPAEYERVTAPTEQLRRWIAAAKLASLASRI